MGGPSIRLQEIDDLRARLAASGGARDEPAGRRGSGRIPRAGERRRTSPACRAVPVFASGPCRSQDLPGGLTNRILRVTTGDGGTYVARLSQPGRLPALRRPRRRGARQPRRRARRRRARRRRPGRRRARAAPASSSSAWLPAGPGRRADLADEANLARLAATCRRLHAGPRFARDFDMFALQRRYLADRARTGPPAAARGTRSSCRRSSRIRRALAVRPVPTVPCHNDLLPAQRARRRRPALDHRLRVRRQQRPLLRARQHLERGLPRPPACSSRSSPPTCGRPRRALVARARLLGLMSKYGWTLWASIQDGVSGRRLRLLVLGDGEVRAGGGRVRRPRPAPAAG